MMGGIASVRGLRGAVNFDITREARTNKKIEPISIAQLLWRNEVEEILQQKKLPPQILRQPRAVLYKYLVNILTICELRKCVREYIKMRKNWRCPEPPSNNHTESIISHPKETPRGRVFGLV